MSAKGDYQSVYGAQQPQQRQMASYKTVTYTPPGASPAVRAQRPSAPRGAPARSAAYNDSDLSGSFSSGDSANSQRMLTGAAARGSARTGPVRTVHSSSPDSSAGYKDATGGSNQPLVNAPEDDDDLHDWRKESHSRAISWRGISNVLTLAILIVGLLTLFAGYPIISHYEKLFSASKMGGFNLGGTNGSGQVPDLPIFSLVDAATPAAAMTRTSPVDNSNYHLVFSDEFEEEGRTFWPGDDPFWTAIDLYYGVTGDYEYYSPDAINTTGGALTITMTQKTTHNLNFQSGMLQSWNKFCFQGGYIEFSMRMPGGPATSGYWPGLWLMGNLGRPGYPGSTDGMWPYSYPGCDAGILRNQTWTNGTGPHDALHSTGTYASASGQLSYLSGMRSSSCTCPGEDHPGPNVNVARSSPELDVLEAQIQTHRGATHAYASQSYQIAPFDINYEWLNTSAAATIYNDDITTLNSYKGNIYQESVSSLTQVPDTGFVDTSNQYITYGVEYTPDWNENGAGSIAWYVNGVPSWKVNGEAFMASPELDIGLRTVSVEPMAIIMNLGMSPSFQPVNFDAGGVTFPATMSVDYVRVYQPDGQADRISCDPPDHPTANYIAEHANIYNNPNLTVYPNAWPKNKLTGC